jgi:drug/metabolite transporter (DMT)-like permease
LLTVLGLLFIFRYLPYLKYWPTLLIIGGVVIIFLPGKKSDKQPAEQNQDFKGKPAQTQ